MKTIYMIYFILFVSISVSNGQNLALGILNTIIKCEENGIYSSSHIRGNKAEFDIYKLLQLRNEKRNLPSATEFTIRKKITTQLTENKYLLDSTVTKDINGVFLSKYIYGYDYNGNYALNAGYTWDKKNSKWKGETKYETTYGSNGKLNLEVYSKWDNDTNCWINRMRYEMTYDIIENMILQVTYTWNQLNKTWEKSDKEENSYNNIGKQALMQIKVWDCTLGDWKDNEKIEMTYDVNGYLNIVTNIYKDNTNNNWYYFSSDEYTFNSLGKETHYISSLWNKTTQVWENDYKTEFNYDSFQNNTSSVTYINVTPGINPSWELHSKDEYSYDTNGNQILLAEYKWDNVNSLWVGLFKVEDAFDSSGKRNLKTDYNWDSSNRSWVGSSKSEITYDSNGNEAFNYSYIYNSGWIQDAISTYYFSEKMNTPVINPDNIKISIFPNPVKNNVQISGLKELSRFTIFDSTGKIVYSKDIFNNESINLSNLSTGTYLIRLTTKEGIVTSKISKK